MVPRTRREVLGGVGLSTVALAGCGRPPAASGTPEAVRSAAPEAGRSTDPTHVMLRSTDEEPLVYEQSRYPDGTSTPRSRHRGFVASPDDLSDLSLADVDGAREVRAFLEATDLDAETVFYQQELVPECYRRELCSVAWTSRSIDTQFADVLRPATVACRTGERDRIAAFVRIPAPLDPRRITSFGSGHSRGAGDCERIARRRASGRRAPSRGGPGADAAGGERR